MRAYEEVLQRAKRRKEQLGVTLEQIAGHTRLGYRTIARFFAGEDVRVSTLEKITGFLGLDFNGESLVDAERLREERASQKARQLVSMVQETSALEMQGVSKEQFELLVEEAREALLHGEYRKMLWAS